MNELHRAVLQKHTQDIVRDMIVTENLLGTMFQKNIFDSEMVEIIKSGRTHSEQAYKMLEFLPKRGPDAYDSFCEVLQEEYPWVAKLLRESVETESERILAAQSKKEDIPLESLTTPRSTSANSKSDADIKIRVSAFVQKHFGQIRRIANADKKAIEWMMIKWLQAERKRLTKSIDDAYMESHQTDVLESQRVKDKIFSLYTHVFSKHQRSPVKKILGRAKAITDGAEGTCTPTDNEHISISPQDINFDILREEVDRLFTHIDYMEKQIDRSYDYLNSRLSGKDISVLVHELCGQYRYKERELVQEKAKTEKMLVELYNFSTNSSRLENSIHAQEHEIVALKEQINKLKEDNLLLIKEVTELEKAKLIHLQKEKTLIELKKAKDDLHVMISVVNKENKELREKMQQNGLNKNNGGRGYPNRRPLANTTNNTQKINPKRAVPKKRSVSFKM
ncbi:uncharacterized protein LOC123540549 [Mercenaria mercenaria]|uniref:uncharacterized protein LOC123540549 n=1 Tax=Mercenaria mercenaria TaxID=6596 RepID=UPI00234F574E|nr:uncharacterized protein LOC123540549 [Mercenaria mercenaria]